MIELASELGCDDFFYGFSEDEDNTERACDTLLMCIVTVLNHGLRNGGGVGDVLRKPSKNVWRPTTVIKYVHI